MREQNSGSSRQAIQSLTRLVAVCKHLATHSLRSPGPPSGQRTENKQNRKNLTRNVLKSWQRAPGFGRTLVDVKRKVLHQPSNLERGSAATRTVVRSISLVFGPDELTHISRINQHPRSAVHLIFVLTSLIAASANPTVHCSISERKTVKNRQPIFNALLTLSEPYQRLQIRHAGPENVNRDSGTEGAIPALSASGLLNEAAVRRGKGDMRLRRWLGD